MSSVPPVQVHLQLIQLVDPEQPGINLKPLHEAVEPVHITHHVQHPVVELLTWAVEQLLELHHHRVAFSTVSGIKYIQLSSKYSLKSFLTKLQAEDSE